MRALVVGGGGHARSVIDAAIAAGIDVVGIVDPDRTASYRAIPVIGTDDDLGVLLGSRAEAAILGIGHLGGPADLREGLAARLCDLGYLLPSVTDPTAAVATDARLADGAFVGKLAVVNSGSSVGEAAIVNSHATVEHDCRVGPFAHVSVGAVLCGGVSVGRAALVGAGATVIQGVSVGCHAVVGAGSVVLADVPAGAKVTGVYHG